MPHAQDKMTPPSEVRRLGPNSPDLLWTDGLVVTPSARTVAERRMLWPPSNKGGNHVEAETQALEQHRESAALCETICRWLRELASRPWISGMMILKGHCALNRRDLL
jgi:hypothetical protein